LKNDWEDLNVNDDFLTLSYIMCQANSIYIHEDIKQIFGVKIVLLSFICTNISLEYYKQTLRQWQCIGCS